MLQTLLWSDIREDMLSTVEDEALNALTSADGRIRPSTIVSFYMDETDADGADEKKYIEGCMERWLIDTATRYTPLIDAVTESKSKLMADVDTTSRNWFNDAPSARNASAMGEDLTHLSTYSKSVSSSGYGTPMQRLKELDDEILNIYERWAREFIAAFSLEREY